MWGHFKQSRNFAAKPLSNKAPVIWNQVPVSVRHSTSVSSFKSAVKTFLFLKTITEDREEEFEVEEDDDEEEDEEEQDEEEEDEEEEDDKEDEDEEEEEDDEEEDEEDGKQE